MFITTTESSVQYKAAVRNDAGKVIFRATSTESQLGAARNAVRKYYGHPAADTVKKATHTQAAAFLNRCGPRNLNSEFWTFDEKAKSRPVIHWSEANCTFLANDTPISLTDARRYWDASGSAQWSQIAYAAMCERIIAE